MGKVKVYGVWASTFSKRVETALKLKGVEYEFVEEDLQNKSDELLRYNPIHKKIPVLVHDGKPIAESLVILEYIDETWKGNPILPSDPYQRAQARFWAKFIDDKLVPQVRIAFRGAGDESEKAIKEVAELLTILENEVEGKLFGGNNIGFLDIVALVVAIWIPCWQKITGKEVLTREKYPRIYTWADELLRCSVIKQSMPDQEKLQAFYRARFASMNIKLLPQVKPGFMSDNGEESEKAIKELDELLTILENEINGKKFFGGKNIGYLDIVASIIPIWIPCWQG